MPESASGHDVRHNARTAGAVRGLDRLDDLPQLLRQEHDREGEAP
ncbi:hypothetical protein [Streptomyces sp. NPDC090131]